MTATTQGLDSARRTNIVKRRDAGASIAEIAKSYRLTPTEVVQFIDAYWAETEALPRRR